MSSIKSSEMTLKNHKGFFGNANDVPLITLETAKADPVLDWKAVKTPVYTKTKDGMMPVDNLYLLQRSDNGELLSKRTVSNTYVPLQNEEALDWFSPYLERDYLELVGYGYFKGGQTIFIQAFNKFESEVNGDKIESYFLLKNHHSGLGLQLNFCTQRAICKNTLDIAASEGKQVSIRHNHLIHDRLEEIHQRIDLAKKSFEFNVETYKQLTKVEMSKKDMLDILTEQFASELKAREKKAEAKGTIALAQDYPIIKAALNAYDFDKTIQHLPNNAWKAYNAFNGVVNHGYGSISPEKGFERTVNGNYINKIVEFKRLALKA